jgi:Cu/Ag efflux pump CusA
MAASTTANKQLDRIEAAIIGNGHEGLLARTARIEEALKAVNSSAVEANEAAEKAAEKAENAATRAADAVNKLALSVTELQSVTKTHLGTDHLSVMMKKKEFWAVIVIGYIALHVIATYVPNVWDWIAVLLGIPKLVLPIG